MDTFGERLRSAMIAKGILTLREQVAALVRAGDVTALEARRWLRMRQAEVSASRLARVAICLDVKTIWLALGIGLPQTSRLLDDDERQAVDVANSLDRTQVQRWLACGRARARERPLQPRR